MLLHLKNKEIAPRKKVFIWQDYQKYYEENPESNSKQKYLPKNTNILIYKKSLPIRISSIQVIKNNWKELFFLFV